MSSTTEALILSRGRSTPARVRVLDCLLRATNALTHGELEERLARDGTLDRVTLYRVLDWLVEQGLAHKIAGEDRVWRFNAVGREEHGHAHFRCTRCGQVFCLDGLRPSFALALPPGYVFGSAELTIQGLCPACNTPRV